MDAECVAEDVEMVLLTHEMIVEIESVVQTLTITSSASTAAAVADRLSWVTRQQPSVMLEQCGWTGRVDAVVTAGIQRWQCPKCGREYEEEVVPGD